jgi:ATP-dependent RNA helicase DDX24/MAK5
MQKQRLSALDKFRSGAASVLLATDVAARGLDIPGVRCVIHYQLAMTAEIYVHRSGRTARAGKDGISIVLVVPAERSRYIALCKGLNRLDGFPEFPVDTTYMPIIKRRVKLAHKVDELTHSQSKEKADETWRRRQAEAMDLALSEDEADDEAKVQLIQKGKQHKAKLDKAQAELNMELRTPLLPDTAGLKGKYLGSGARLEIQQAAKQGKELGKVEAIAAFSDNTKKSDKSLQLKKFRPSKQASKVETSMQKMRKVQKQWGGGGGREKGGRAEGGGGKGKGGGGGGKQKSGKKARHK